MSVKVCAAWYPWLNYIRSLHINKPGRLVQFPFLETLPFLGFHDFCPGCFQRPSAGLAHSPAWLSLRQTPSRRRAPALNQCYQQMCPRSSCPRVRFQGCRPWPARCASCGGRGLLYINPRTFLRGDSSSDFPGGSSPPALEELTVRVNTSSAEVALCMPLCPRKSCQPPMTASVQKWSKSFSETR